MLEKNKLLIDENCPMCNIYGWCFTKIGLVDSETISPYQKVPKHLTHHIDMHRAKNEIALLDTKTNHTKYGIDAMINIVSHNSKWLSKILNSVVAYPFLLRLYRFISYNRKVIYPSATSIDSRDCTPDVNKKYRILYFGVVSLVFGSVFAQFFEVLSTNVDFWNLFLGFWSIILVKILFFNRFYPQKTLNYLGNFSTVCLIGSLLLIPFLLIQAYISTSVLIFCGELVTVTMIVELGRRCKLLGLR